MFKSSAVLLLSIRAFPYGGNVNHLTSFAIFQWNDEEERDKFRVAPRSAES